MRSQLETVRRDTALEVAKELYEELYENHEHSDMQRYKLEELIEILEYAHD